jgi:hypothetical protein
LPATGITAVTVNVTSILSNGLGGYLTVFPSGTSLPLASNINFGPNQIIPNRVTVPIGSNGSITVFNFSGDTNVAVDVNGYYLSGSGYNFVASGPIRICDTRNTSPANQCSGMTLNSGATDNVNVAGINGISQGAIAVVANVTSTNTNAVSYYTIYPSQTSFPLISDLNWFPGRTVANMTEVKLGSSGGISVYNYSGSADLIIDVFGWFQ